MGAENETPTPTLTTENTTAPEGETSMETTETVEEKKYGRKAVFASAIGYGLDGFDLLILSFALSGIIASFGLSNVQAGSLTTLTLLGAVLGGFVFGVLSDRLGRVRMLTYSVVLFSVFTGLSAIAIGYWDLAAYRFIAGIGIGGEFDIGMTLASEAVSASKRARATSWVALGFQFGVLAAALGSAPIIATFGWRGLFVVGILPAIFAVIVRKRLHEPAKFVAYQEAANEQEAPQKSSLRMLWDTPARRRTTIAIAVLATVQNFGYFGIITWLPNYLSTQIGLDVTGSSLWTAVTVLGMMLGIVVFGQLGDRIGRRKTFWIIQLGAAGSVLVYSLIDNPVQLLIGGFVMGFFANGMLGLLGALISEHYPTEARATAQNVLFNFGRGLAGFAPVIIALIADNHGFAFALGLLPVIYLLAFVAMFFIPERTGAELE